MNQSILDLQYFSLIEQNQFQSFVLFSTFRACFCLLTPVLGQLTPDDEESMNISASGVSFL